MRFYRVGISCDHGTCGAAWGRSIVHDDITALDNLAGNQERILAGEGWLIDPGISAYCPEHRGLYENASANARALSALSAEKRRVKRKPTPTEAA